MLTSCQLVVFKAVEVASMPTDMDYVELCGPGRFRDTLLLAIECGVGGPRVPSAAVARTKKR